MPAPFQPYTRRQTMIASDFEVYRYRSTYMNEVALHQIGRASCRERV